MYDGVVGDFQPAVAWSALFSAAFGDELRVHHTFAENLEFDQRRVTENNATYALSVFNGLHRARFMADSVASRYKGLLGDSASYDVRYTRMLSYAGYAWTLLGEQICETRINGQGAPLQPPELFAQALERFEAAIAAAEAAKAAAGANALAAARADSALNLARVGAARVALNLGDDAAAAAYAAAVEPAYLSTAEPGFRYDLHYVQVNSAPERRHANPFFEFIGQGGSWMSLSGTGYENLNDPRVPHDTAGAITVAGGGLYFVPNSPASFGTYDGTVKGTRFAGTSTLRLASAIEARYILAEVGGATPDNVDFLNAQRAIGGQEPLTAPTLDEYLAALREQRVREFFIDGHRLGDLRRYEAQYGVDDWPSGAMYGGTVTFGEQKCFPTPVSETF